MENKKEEGFIYILTNPAFKEYVKIGYTTDVNRRLSELNNKTAIPLSFRVYATYKVQVKDADKQIHRIIDLIDDDKRESETIDGKKRIREFYIMSAEEAYAILDAIATINDKKDCLKKWPISQEDKQQLLLAEKVRKRSENFSFDKCEIPVGATIEFSIDPEKKATVLENNRVDYNGEEYSLTKLAQTLLGSNNAVQGPKFFKYNGKFLTDIRKEKEEQ